jgi:hypothetical protein
MKTPQCADINADGEVRCPVVDCNEQTGRFLFQFFDGGEPLLHNESYMAFLAELPARERKRKIRYLQRGL